MAAVFDVEQVRREFPLLERRVGDQPLVYFDSAATSLKPRAVIDAVVACYTRHTANVHRGVHLLSEEASHRFDEARDTVAAFLGVGPREIVFTKNATEAVNLVARSQPAGARILATLGEHHSNFLPWGQVGQVRLVGLDSQGRIRLDEYRRLLTEWRPALVAVSWISNALGVVHPIGELVSLARAAGARVLVDASQAVPHRPVDLRSLGCDYLCFSGHKMCGPSGVGVLAAPREALAALRPLLYGGDMVEAVHAEAFELRELPMALEAGTPAIEAVCGLAAACRFLEDCGQAAIEAHERQLVAHAWRRLREVPGVICHGPHDLAERASAIPFTVAGLEPNAVARLLSNRYQICVRSGFHCAQPAHEALGLGPTVRASFYLYNTPAEIDLLAEGLTQLTSNLPGNR